MRRNNLFSIGEVSRLFHISVSTLRHYENVGLLSPAYISPDSGYRYYGTEQFEVLNTIRYLRALDMPLSEIVNFLQGRDPGKIEDMLRQQQRAIAQRQQELARIASKIDHRLERLQDARGAALGNIEQVITPACSIVWVDQPLQVNGYLDMEAPIRLLDRESDEAVVFLGKVGLGITTEHLQEGSCAPYDGIFLMLDAEDAYTGETVRLPESRCVRLRFRGSHTEAPEQYRRLLQYIGEHHLEIIGFSREITLIDYGLTSDPDEFVTEICIPVE